MKIARIMSVGLITLAILGPGNMHGQPKPAKEAEINVVELKSVPDGFYLVNLQINREERLLNLEVRNGAAKCVRSGDQRLVGMAGDFQRIGNGVFLIFLKNEQHRASQFWVFQKDGSAQVKEVPDRGEKQSALPVPDGSLDRPKKT